MRLRLALAVVVVFVLLLGAGGYVFYRLVILPPASEIAEVKAPGQTQDASGGNAGAPQDGQASDAVMGPPVNPNSGQNPAEKANPTPDVTLLSPKPVQDSGTDLVPPKDGSITTLPPATSDSGTFAPVPDKASPAGTGAPAGGADSGAALGTDSSGQPVGDGAAQPGQGGINPADLPTLPAPDNGTGSPSAIGAPDAGSAGGSNNAIDLMNNGGNSAQPATQPAPSGGLVPPAPLPNGQAPVPDTGNGTLPDTQQPPAPSDTGGGGGPIDLLP